MSKFSRIIGTSLLASSVGLPYLATERGLGMGSERNPSIIKEMRKSCPQHMRRADGSCRRSHRSYYYGRSFYGGGPRGGK